MKKACREPVVDSVVNYLTSWIKKKKKIEKEHIKCKVRINGIRNQYNGLRFLLQQ